MMNIMSDYRDCRKPYGILKLHDELLEYARKGGVYLSSTDCRRMVIQLIYELAQNPMQKIVPLLPCPVVTQPAANTNLKENEAA